MVKPALGIGLRSTDVVVVVVAAAAGDCALSLGIIMRCGGGGDGGDDKVLGITGYNGCVVPWRRSLSYSRICSILGCLEMFPSYGSPLDSTSKFSLFRCHKVQILECKILPCLW